MYSMTIVRGVNGLVDPSQQGFFADSVMSLASKIGLPSWFVDLRHEATHAQLPSLNILRNAASSLLKWYEHNYWDKQSDFLSLRRDFIRCEQFSYFAKSDLDTTKWNGDILVLKGSTFLTSIFIPMFVDSIIATAWQGVREGCVVRDLLDKRWVDIVRGVVAGGVIAPYLSSNEYSVETWSAKDVGGVIITHLVEAALRTILVNREERSVVSNDKSSCAETLHPTQSVVVLLSLWIQNISNLTGPGSIARPNAISQDPPPSLLPVWRKYLSLLADMSDSQRRVFDYLRDILQELYKVELDQGNKRQREHAETVELSLVASAVAAKSDDLSSTHSAENGPQKRKIRISRRAGWPLGSCIGDVADNGYLLSVLDMTPNCS